MKVFARQVGLVVLFAFGISWGSLAEPAGSQEGPANALPGKDPQVGQTFRVPYLRTLTNHYLVRVRINGKGPFNFLVDTGAPALFIGTEAAKAAGLEPPGPGSREFWTKIDRFDIEGGIELRNIKGRTQDVFQLKGMNALGLPGARIDGILGFTILARFRMEFDPRDDRLTWTRLDYDPKDPFVPSDPKDRAAPADVQAMEMLGPMMQVASLFIGKQPEDTKLGQGVIGIEVDERDGEVRIASVLPDTPAAAAGLKAGDVLVAIEDRGIAERDHAHAAIERMRPGDRIVVKVRRAGEEKVFSLNAASGL